MFSTYKVWILRLFILITCITGLHAASNPAQGLVDLVQRRMPDHVNNFNFVLNNSTTTGLKNDSYSVTSSGNGIITVQGNSLSALATG